MLQPAPSYYRDRLCKTLLAVALLVNAFCFPAQAYAEEERLPEAVAIEALLASEAVSSPTQQHRPYTSYWLSVVDIGIPVESCLFDQLIHAHTQLARIHLKVFSTSRGTLRTNLLLPIISSRSSIDEPVLLS